MGGISGYPLVLPARAQKISPWPGTAPIQAAGNRGGIRDSRLVLCMGLIALDKCFAVDATGYSGVGVFTNKQQRQRDGLSYKSSQATCLTVETTLMAGLPSF